MPFKFSINPYTGRQDISAAAIASGSSTGMRGSRLVAMGDSTTEASYDNSNTNMTSGGICWPIYAQIKGNGAWQLIYNAGQAGENTANMLARFYTDVVARGASHVVILAGRNDVGKPGVSSAYSVVNYGSCANIHAMVQMALANGIGVTISNMTPVRRSGLTDGSPTLGTVYSTIYNDQWFNMWLNLYCRKYNLGFVDIFSKLWDADAEDWISGYSTDGVHPGTASSNAATDIMATQINNVLTGVTRGVKVPLALLDFQSATLTGFPGFINMCNNPLMLSNTGGTATSWHQSVNATLTKTIITGDSNILGNWQQFQPNTNATGYMLYQGLGGAFVDGTTVTLTVDASNLKIVVKNTNWSAGHVGNILRITSASSSGWIPGDYIIVAVASAQATLDRAPHTVLGSTGARGAFGLGGGPVNVGDRILISGLMQTEVLASSNIAYAHTLQFDVAGAGNTKPYVSNNLENNPAGGFAFCHEFIVPAGATGGCVFNSTINSNDLNTKIRLRPIRLFQFNSTRVPVHLGA